MEQNFLVYWGKPRRNKGNLRKDVRSCPTSYQPFILEVGGVKALGLPPRVI
jgi:hypothetical protein